MPGSAHARSLPALAQARLRAIEEGLPLVARRQHRHLGDGRSATAGCSRAASGSTERRARCRLLPAPLPPLACRRGRGGRIVLWRCYWPSLINSCSGLYGGSILQGAPTDDCRAYRVGTRSGPATGSRPRAIEPMRARAADGKGPQSDRHPRRQRRAHAPRAARHEPGEARRCCSASPSSRSRSTRRAPTGSAPAGCIRSRAVLGRAGRYFFDGAAASRAARPRACRGRRLELRRRLRCADVAKALELIEAFIAHRRRPRSAAHRRARDGARELPTSAAADLSGPASSAAGRRPRA